MMIFCIGYKYETVIKVYFKGSLVGKYEIQHMEKLFIFVLCFRDSHLENLMSIPSIINLK